LSLVIRAFERAGARIPCGQKIETIVESGNCLGVALRVVLRYFRGDRGVARCDGAKGDLWSGHAFLAYITGSVDRELLLRNEYLAAENRILRTKLNRRLQCSDAERPTLDEIGFRLGRRTLSEVATAAQPDAILAGYRRLVARKFDGSQSRRGSGRPRIDQGVEGLIVRMARENRSWGYGRIVGALANLGYRVSDQTVGNVLRRHGIPPAPERRHTTTWAEFIRTHVALLADCARNHAG
jgi:hypothetical protein